MKKSAEVLYIAGKGGAGKTPTCNIIKDLLIKNDFTILEEKDLDNKDAIYLLNKANQHIVICTASDTKSIIEKLDNFLKEIFSNFNIKKLILILAIRNGGDNMRSYLKEIISTRVEVTDQLEIPLAKINGNSREEVYGWYRKSIDTLIEYILLEKLL